MNKTLTLVLTFFLLTSCFVANDNPIDREALVRRHNVHVTSVDTDAALSVGNGDFAFTVGATGLQCLADLYHEKGIPTETMATWAWHSFPNVNNYTLEQTYKGYDFHGKQIDFAAHEKTPEGQYFRINPHPAALGQLSLLYKGKEITPEQLTSIDQKLDLWTGIITSHYLLDGTPVDVVTLAHSDRSMVAVDVHSPLIRNSELEVRLRFPYAYNASTKNKPALIWDNPQAHTTTMTKESDNEVSLSRQVDDFQYVTSVAWEGASNFMQAEEHDFRLQTANNSDRITLVCEFVHNPTNESKKINSCNFAEARSSSINAWKHYWTTGGAIDLSQSTDSRAHELERRIVQSQYVLKINYAGSFPPSECGLVTPTWYGKHNSEVYFIHAAHFYQFGRTELLEKSLNYYRQLLPIAIESAASKGWEGARWPKMFGEGGRETPGSINPFIIWNFPNPIYLCELVYRANPTPETLAKYKDVVLESGKFLASYATYDAKNDRYMLGPPLKASSESSLESETWNPTFELALWYYGLQTAQEWRIRLGMQPDSKWAEVLNKLSKPTIVQGKYVEIETEAHIYDDANKGMPTSMIYALGYVPPTPLIDKEVMRETFHELLRRSRNGFGRWVSWSMGQGANTAVRLGEYETAINIVTNDVPAAQFLPQGYSKRPKEPDGCPAYMPINGSFLNAIGLMAGGWDGAPDVVAPGFPKDGTWVVKVEGMNAMP
ncbi:hypothetical protein D0T50_01960 [Bacteroides sp. 214]|uniref:hypothetical protein n=1 Tax=Bacteroides sp. 214 TaxID=2302935 RepID=UPI0013D3CF9E|nr:hypothetical protein [Bacteroides sp. 214]NDW11652.1 hypothetical protein [Bacteroides sp. 214]